MSTVVRSTKKIILLGITLTIEPDKTKPFQIYSDKIISNLLVIQIQNFTGNNPQQFPNYNSGAIPKRTREISDSSKSPFHKQQRINHLPDSKPISEGSDTEESQSDVSDVIDDIPNHEVNFLG